MVKSIFSLLLLMWSGALLAQESKKNEHGHEHDHHRNEIGIGHSPVYFLDEKTFAYGLHMHYIYNIPESKFGCGLGYERIFDEHRHNTLGLVGNFRPVDHVSLSLSPGLSFEEDNFSSAHFALHIETAYEFEVKNVHLGPVIEVAYDKEDVHISLGVHIGLGF